MQGVEIAVTSNGRDSSILVHPTALAVTPATVNLIASLILTIHPGNYKTLVLRRTPSALGRNGMTQRAGVLGLTSGM
jgi:hypothetical protein